MTVSSLYSGTGGNASWLRTMQQSVHVTCITHLVVAHNCIK